MKNLTYLAPYRYPCTNENMLFFFIKSDSDYDFFFFEGGGLTGPAEFRKIVSEKRVVYACTLIIMS